ncbi:MAG: exodeoxyribonuclease VII small subunit [Deltaproteobacteria bacterium]|nr:exodeoxyribonuclease VII small subunit [Deltaproteobacteria bacterium]
MPREKKEKFEDALQKLEKIVSQLEEGDISLEESLKLFEEGIRLSRFCGQKLDEAEKRVEILLKDKDGELIREPFDPSKSTGQRSSNNPGQFSFEYSTDNEPEEDE